MNERDSPSGPGRNSKICQYRSEKKFCNEECVNKGLKKTSVHNRSIGPDQIKREVASVRNRLKSSLNAAIRGESVKQCANSEEQPNANGVVESVARQAEINRIEEPGFRPSSFRTGTDTSRKMMWKISHQSKSDASIHDRAMFGPIWAGKEVEGEQKKLQAVAGREAQKRRKDTHSQPAESNGRLATRFPLAHELLSQNAEKRNQRWKELFRERRQNAMDNTL